MDPVVFIILMGLIVGYAADRWYKSHDTFED